MEKALRDETLKKDKWLLHDLVNLHLSMRDVRAARARIDALLALQPTMRKAQLDEARVLAEEGRFGDAYRNELVEFAACIREERRPEITVQDGVAATRIALAATRAFREGGVVGISE